jgi:hypothetical protein
MSTTYFPEPRGHTLEFNIDWTPATKTLETIKWVISKEKYEIYHGLCTRFELHEIILHCLMVIHKIDGQVGDHDNKKLQSYKQVLPQTLSIPLVGVWEQMVVEYNEANLDEDETLASFAKTLFRTVRSHDYAHRAPSLFLCPRTQEALQGQGSSHAHGTLQGSQVWTSLQSCAASWAVPRARQDQEQASRFTKQVGWTSNNQEDWQYSCQFD